ncbi:permease-like cell division protein FtsX [bacterium]|nr:permease-like cell division protein FtsX [bacterium]
MSKDSQKPKHYKSGVVDIEPNAAKSSLDPNGKTVSQSREQAKKRHSQANPEQKKTKIITESPKENNPLAIESMQDSALPEQSKANDAKRERPLAPNPEFLPKSQSQAAADKALEDALEDDLPPIKKRRGPSGGYYIECFLREVVTNIRHNPMMSVASVSTVMVLALILGLFVLIIANLETLADELAGEMHIKAYMRADFDPESINDFKTQVYDIGHVAKVNFISKDEAFKRLRQKLSASLDLNDLDGNPLPDAFEIPVDDPAFLEPAAKKIAELPGVESVDYGREEAQKLMKLNHIIRVVGIIILVLLFASTLLIISNTIRLTVFARRKEIDIMQLVGAADWFIRWPFILEGVVQGALGSGAASVMIDMSYRIVVPQIQRSISFLPILTPGQIMPYLNIGLVFLGCAVGALGSLISVNRYLKA